MSKRLFLPLVILTILSIFFSACTQPPGSSSGKLTVLATTTFIGDVAANIGGDLIDLSVMMPPGADPHSFEPAPADLSKVADADLVFVNGIQFEAFLEKLIENAGDKAKVIVVSDGIETLAFAQGMDEHAEEGEEHDEYADEEHAHEHGEFDPHVWHDPNNVIIWANNIATALSERDPVNAASYRANADVYIAQLHDLDTWAEEQLTTIPKEARGIVTEHDSLGYFSHRFGLEIVGAVIPSFSTLAEPSAQELADLENNIRALGVKAILVGNTVNPALANQIAQDTGIELVPIYSDSLSPADGPASTYLDFMRYNVDAIVGALK